MFQAAAESAPILALQPLDLPQLIDLEREDSKEEEEDKEASLHVATEVHIEASGEQSPSNVVVHVLSKLAPEEEVAEPTSKTESELVEV